MGMNSQNMHFDHIREAAAVVKTRFPQIPTVAILTGTGLGDIHRFLTNTQTLSYAEIPYFPIPTVESHIGSFSLGFMNQFPVFLLNGRAHLYEGFSSKEVTFSIRLLQALNIKTLILTNAAGGIGDTVQTGDILLITDHINLTGENPLVGVAPEEWGDRFPDMAFVYDQQLLLVAEEIARKNQLPICKGIYCGLKGPSLETPAEVRYLKTIGGNAVGFSTVLEAIVGVAANMKILGLSAITNKHTPDAPQKTSLEEVITAAGKIAPAITTLLSNLLTQLSSNNLGK